MLGVQQVRIRSMVIMSALLGSTTLTLPLCQANQSDGSTNENTATPLTAQQASSAVTELRHRNLLLPLSEFDIERAKDSYTELRDGQSHEALDMLAPRNTPVLAVEDGEIAKLFESKPGGTTVYQYDPTRHYIYYYAHLEKYAANLKDGQKVKRGQLLGYVGTSGNAPKNTPHLHFSISVVDADKRWWQTAPVNPYLVFKKY